MIHVLIKTQQLHFLAFQFNKLTLIVGADPYVNYCHLLKKYNPYNWNWNCIEML
jgi:hypothetical protein